MQNYELMIIVFIVGTALFLMGMRSNKSDRNQAQNT